MDIVDVSVFRDKKIVVMGAHSDDAEFLAGGTLLRLAKEKYHNTLIQVVATDGRMGGHEFDYDGEAYVQARMAEARKAGEALGSEVVFWNYPDLGLRERRKHLLKRVVKFLLKERPEVVFSFDPWGMYDMYVHPDHRTMAEVVSEAVMLATLPRWIQKHGLGRRKLAVKPEIWLFQPAQANVAVDVSSVWGERVGLLEHFESQFDEHFQWERVITKVSDKAQKVGLEVGVDFAEGFRVMK